MQQSYWTHRYCAYVSVHFDVTLPVRCVCSAFDLRSCCVSDLASIRKCVCAQAIVWRFFKHKLEHSNTKRNYTNIWYEERMYAHCTLHITDTHAHTHVTLVTYCKFLYRIRDSKSVDKIGCRFRLKIDELKFKRGCNFINEHVRRWFLSVSWNSF